MPARPEGFRDQFKRAKGAMRKRHTIVRAARNEDRYIRVGSAVVVYDYDKQAWALTGRRYTRDRYRANEHAILMDRIMKRGMACE